MIEPIPANSLHAKQLPPHLRRRKSGSSATYIEFPPVDNKIYQVVAAEPLSKGNFGCVVNNLLYKAGVNLGRAANCYVLNDVAANETANVVLGDYIVDAENGNLGTLTFLGVDGCFANTPPSGSFEQVLGVALTPTTFYLLFAPPIWKEL